MTRRICCSPDSPAEEYPDKPSVEETEKLIKEGFGNRSFENELANEYIHGNFEPTSLRSYWIRDHLSDVKVDTPKRMWKCFVVFIEAQDLDSDFESYSDFANCIYRLLELNLVKSRAEGAKSKESGSEQGEILLKVVEENLHWSMAWRNPLKMIYPHSWRSWVEKKLKEGLTPADIAERAGKITPRSIDVVESGVLQNMKEWGLE